jgi:molybdenum cofactor cytidylyltransferase
MRASTSIGAVVLAAGRSRRMGREKALLAWGRETSLERVLAALASASHVCVVLRPDLADAEAAGGVARKAGASVLVNADPDAEMLDSVRIGAAGLSESLEAFFVWPVDHPLVTPETLGRLEDAADRAAVAIPTFRGRRGHPALVGMKLRSDLLALPRGAGLRDLWHGVAPPPVREVVVDDPGVVTNVDTPEQYAEALRRTGLGV